MKWSAICLALAGALLSACAPSSTRPSVAYNQAREEMRQAISERSAPDDEAALMPPLSVEMPKNVEVEPRFDLSVVNAPAVQVFMALVTGTRYNMLVTPEVTGQITIQLKDVTVREALDAIRELYGYEYVIKGNRIAIQPNTMQTRMFQVNYLASKRLGATTLRVTSGASNVGPGSTGTNAPQPAAGQTPGQGGQGGTSANVTTQVRTETDSNFWGGLTTALTTIVGSEEGRSVVVNQESGMILVRALPRELRSVESYLKATQLVVERQVVLEAKIIDVTLSRDYQSGINWAAFNGVSNTSAIGVSGATAILQSSSSSGGARPIGAAETSVVTPGKFGTIVAQSLGKGFFGLALQTANFAALLNFLETQGSVSVLSSPRIATLNNQKAVLKVGTDDLFVTGVTTTTTTTTTGNPIITPTVTLQSYFSGIALDVTPQIDEDNNIILHIHPSVSVVTEKTKTLNLGTTIGTYVLPLASSSVNETDAVVRARDGNIIAIGGLMRQEQDVANTQLPGAEKFGAAGTLLGQRGNTLSKRELVILLKPTVITADQAWVKDLADTNERLRSMDPAQFSLQKE